MDMYYIENEQLIACVKERPVLWDKSIEHYKCRNSTAFAWKEVCSKLHDNYENLESLDKENFGRHVMKKWTNLKDCWWRSTKRGADGSTPGIRPYRYYKELSFLKKNHKQSNGPVWNNTDVQGSDSNGSDNLQLDIVETQLSVITSEKDDTKIKESQVAERITEHPSAENRHISFIKGILPTLQLLNEDQVLKFQIEVLRILHQIKHSKSTQNYSTLSSNF